MKELAQMVGTKHRPGQQETSLRISQIKGGGKLLFSFGLMSYQEAGSGLQMTIFPALECSPVCKMKPGKW